ncbi:glycosyl hydrolase [Massilia dura]|uniref:Glycosyl hydrolase n=1 Tax=Pseudoduganella dura TaxID=321982 RepID=A0A6I3XE83_9BURK|nr:glycosyl hydrolase [Pseudoduganella dura]MUI15254.1 glycosyl hydrolase [Pseudoduganella dura]GGY06612.1 oxidoreductase [Pseudoduganella dura]
MRIAIALAAMLVAAPALAAQDAPRPAWQPQAAATQVELRGLSVVSSTVAWASGAKGTVLRTVDGATWTVLAVPGADKLDFRDIHAVDASTAIVMSAGPGDASRIYRTADGGATWQLSVTNPDPRGFWDAIAFRDARHGILFGDPVDGRFQVRVTSDGGETWQPVKDDEGLRALPDEGAFAASGTCLTVAGSGDAWFATGGAQNPRVFHSKDGGRTWQAAAVPVAAGAPARGLFSVAFGDPQVGIAAGGDYKEVNLAGVNGARTEDGGASWTPVQVLPAGYMSVVVPVRGAPGAFVAAGLAGSGYSTDAGKSWKILDRTPVNTVAFASPAAGWAVGPKGLVLRYTGAPLNK